MVIRFNNRPPHIYLDDTYYFITARTIDLKNYFNTENKKKILKSIMMRAVKKFELSLLAWVILSNHYHLIIKIDSKNKLSSFINNFHANSSRELNTLENKQGRKIWWNYFDKCLESEKDFWTRFNYIHNNPIKHGYVRSLNELKNYKFSSYDFYLKKFGREWLNSVFEQYPIADFTSLDD